MQSVKNALASKLYSAIVEKFGKEPPASAQLAEMNKKLPIFKQVAVTEVRWEEFEKTPSRKIKRYKVK